MWKKVISYQTTITVKGKTYRISCEKQDDGYDILINREFFVDVDKLPSLSELESIIKEYLEYGL